MAEAPAQTVKENPLVEKIGKDKVRVIAALGIAAAGFLGISGKPNSGVGVGVEVPNPMTGENALVGVAASSTEGQDPYGLPEEVLKADNFEIYQVNIGGAKLSVYKGDIKRGDMTKTVVGIYPAGETALGIR